jgi:LmbE family N-acetylglucosaminyl deacetylase
MAQNLLRSLRSRFQWRRLLPGLLIWPALLPPSFGQSQDLYLDRGAVGLSQSLKRLPLISRVLFVTAHPDDEPAGLVTYVSRGLQARTAILSLTRGEGGQNLVGPDLFEALGQVRTGEMLAANEFYGAGQYFSRAFDFGFSKSAEETLDKWGRQRILEDLVRTIRSFRPLVILSVFDGTPADGHGHHQACGLLAREAFEISGNPDRFPELTRQGLPPWKAARLYLRNRSENPSESFSIDTGAYDPWLGASFRQIGAQGYSLHRSQGMGRAHAFPGSHPVKLRLGGISVSAPLSGSSDASPSRRMARARPSSGSRISSRSRSVTARPSLLRLTLTSYPRSRRSARKAAWPIAEME